jgi:hypothetical protein
MHGIYTNPVNIDELLLTKKLEPLAPEHAETLKKIERLDVAGFTEAEVRYSVIDPIVRILGYDKGTIFSLDLEHQLTFLGKTRRPDYQLNLWNEGFWLIEAKKPRLDNDKFEYDDLAQAIEYSVHPKVNAALVALCDGVKIEVFDREVNVEEPIVRVARENLSRDFDKLRIVLEPIQIWYFQKRRVLRLLDKVFDREFNMHRVEEFSDLVRGRLQSKRNQILENFRSNVKPDSEEQRQRALSATVEDLIEAYFFFELPIPITNSVNIRLVQLSEHNTFHVIHRMFPSAPRTANDIYMAQAVTYLMALAEKRDTVQAIPAWLAQGGSQSGPVLDSAIKFLLQQCLTYFADYEPYRLILLAACAARRISKILAVSSGAIQKWGEELHAQARHTLPEVSWAQIVASPEGQLINLIDSQTMMILDHFVKQNSGQNYSFLNASAKLQLKGYWEFEKNLLGKIENYAQLLKERPLGEMRMTEWSSITYDNLGHGALCLLHRFPKWKDYLLQERLPLLEDLAALGSWAAKKMLGVQPQDKFGSVSDAELANRFFLGDVGTLRVLRAAYGG